MSRSSVNHRHHHHIHNHPIAHYNLRSSRERMYHNLSHHVHRSNQHKHSRFCRLRESYNRASHECPGRLPSKSNPCSLGTATHPLEVPRRNNYHTVPSFGPTFQLIVIPVSLPYRLTRSLTPFFVPLIVLGTCSAVIPNGILHSFAATIAVVPSLNFTPILNVVFTPPEAAAVTIFGTVTVYPSTITSICCIHSIVVGRPLVSAYPAIYH